MKVRFSVPEALSAFARIKDATMQGDLMAQQEARRRQEQQLQMDLTLRQLARQEQQDRMEQERYQAGLMQDRRNAAAKVLAGFTGQYPEMNPAELARTQQGLLTAENPEAYSAEAIQRLQGLGSGLGRTATRIQQDDQTADLLGKLAGNYPQGQAGIAQSIADLQAGRGIQPRPVALPLPTPGGTVARFNLPGTVQTVIAGAGPHKDTLRSAEQQRRDERIAQARLERDRILQGMRSNDAAAKESSRLYAQYEKQAEAMGFLDEADKHDYVRRNVEAAMTQWNLGQSGTAQPGVLSQVGGVPVNAPFDTQGTPQATAQGAAPAPGTSLSVNLGAPAQPRPKFVGPDGKPSTVPLPQAKVLAGINQGQQRVNIAEGTAKAREKRMGVQDDKDRAAIEKLKAETAQVANLAQARIKHYQALEKKALSDGGAAGGYPGGAKAFQSALVYHRMREFDVAKEINRIHQDLRQGKVGGPKDQSFIDANKRLYGADGNPGLYQILRGLQAEGDRLLGQVGSPYLDADPAARRQRRETLIQKARQRGLTPQQAEAIANAAQRDGKL